MQPQISHNPHEEMRGFLSFQYKEVSAFLCRIGVLPDYEKYVARLIEKGKQYGDKEILFDTNSLVAEIAREQRATGEALSIPELGLFSRRFFNGFFRDLRIAAEQRAWPNWVNKEKLSEIEETLGNFFPLYVLCVDYDNLKRLNDEICGHLEANKVLIQNNKILYQTARTHLPRIGLRDRREPPNNRYLLPDLLCQFQSGDEIAVLLSQARSLKEAESVGKRFKRNLNLAPPVPVLGLDRERTEAKLMATCAACVIPDPYADAEVIVDEALKRVKAEKKAQRLLRAERAA